MHYADDKKQQTIRNKKINVNKKVLVPQPNLLDANTVDGRELLRRGNVLLTRGIMMISKYHGTVADSRTNEQNDARGLAAAFLEGCRAKGNRVVRRRPGGLDNVAVGGRDRLLRAPVGRAVVHVGALLEASKELPVRTPPLQGTGRISD